MISTESKSSEFSKNGGYCFRCRLNAIKNKILAGERGFRGGRNNYPLSLVDGGSPTRLTIAFNEPSRRVCVSRKTPLSRRPTCSARSRTIKRANSHASGGNARGNGRGTTRTLRAVSVLCLDTLRNTRHCCSDLLFPATTLRRS